MVAELEVDWPVIVGVLLEGDGRDRDVAAWRTCADTVRRLDAFAPGTLREPADWTAQDRAAIASLHSLHGDALREAAQSMPRAFGLWRAHITDFEATESRKLEMLVWTLSELYALRDRASDVAKVDALISRVGEALQVTWNVPSVPRDGSATYRAWASRHTRRYDALPRAWRSV